MTIPMVLDSLWRRQAPQEKITFCHPLASFSFTFFSDLDLQNVQFSLQKWCENQKKIRYFLKRFCAQVAKFFAFLLSGR